MDAINTASCSIWLYPVLFLRVFHRNCKQLLTGNSPCNIDDNNNMQNLHSVIASFCLTCSDNGEYYNFTVKVIGIQLTAVRRKAVQ